jgi:signal transduction histidine kinase
VLDPQPGLDRIDSLVEGVREAGLTVELVIEGDRRAVAPGLDVSAYRIVQEALTNVIRHARGTKARVRVTYGAHDVGIEVADDGVGPRANGTRPGHGLVGMRERASLYGGDLQIGRSELGGYLVSARLPLPP